MEKNSKQEPESEGARLAVEVIDALLKAKKLFKMYPPNNPIYVKASETVFEKFKSFFLHDEALSLRITQNHIYYNDDEVYHNPEKDDNLALFFFKDGVKELTVSQGITPEELEEFLRVLAIDFEKEAPDDDIVTALWEKDFEHIHFVADDVLLTDEELSEELRAAEKIRENTYTEEHLKQAYQDSRDAEPEKEYTPAPLSDADLQHIAQDLDYQEKSKIEKFTTILFELLYLTNKPEVFRSVVGSIKSTLDYCLKGGDFRNSSYILTKIKKDVDEGVFERAELKSLESVYVSINSSPFIKVIGEVLESSTIIHESDYLEYIKHLGKNSIPSFMLLLGEIESLKGRHLVTEALSVIGHHDIDSIAMGLKDNRWNIVRDTIFILGKIGSTGAFEHLTNILSHRDERIRREAVRTIGSIKSPDTYLYLSKALNDRDASVRIIAARSLGNFKTSEVRKVLLSTLTRKDFTSREFSEKKAFYGIIASWADREVKDFLMKTLGSWKIWKRARHDETRACAAYALGILKERDAIPLLTKTGRSKNKALRESSLNALNKIKA